KVLLPILNRRNQSRPEYRATAEAELWLFVNIALVIQPAVLPEGLAAEAASNPAIVESADVVHVRRKEKRPRLEYQDALVLTQTFRQVVSQDAAPHPRTHDDDVEVRPRPMVLCEQPPLHFASLGNEPRK